LPRREGDRRNARLIHHVVQTGHALCHHVPPDGREHDEAGKADKVVQRWSSRRRTAESRRRKRDREAGEANIVARMEQGTGAEVFELDWDALAEMEGFEECGIRSADDLESITLQLLKGTTADGPGELKFAEIFNYHEQTTGGRECAGAKLVVGNPTVGDGMRQQVQFAHRDYPEQVDRLTGYGFCNPWRTGEGGLEGGSSGGCDNSNGEVCGEGNREGQAQRSRKVGKEGGGERKTGRARASEGGREGNELKNKESSSSAQASQRRKNPGTHGRREKFKKESIFF